MPDIISPCATQFMPAMSNRTSHRAVLRDPMTISPGESAGRVYAAPETQAFERVARIAVAALRATDALVSRIEKGRVEVLAHGFGRETVSQDGSVAANRVVAIAAARTGELAVLAEAADGAGALAAMAMPHLHRESGRTYVLSVLSPAGRDWSDDDYAVIADLVVVLDREIRDGEGWAASDAHDESKTSLLFREMEHRVKNSLSTVQALVSLSLQGEGPIAAMRERLIERIGAMAKTQALLLQDQLESASLADIVASEAGHYGADRVCWSGPPVRIFASDVTPIGMILHELGTNAAKHGALSTESAGQVDIRWSEEREPNARRILRLEWHESGGPPLRGVPDGEGFGTTLLDLLVTGQFRGRIERSWNPDGLVFVARLSLSAESGRFT